MSIADPPPSRIVGIGASAGGIDALLRVLSAIPESCPHVICVVLHVPAAGDSVLPAILDRRCALTVVPARHGEPILAGHVYVAPPDRHLTVHGAVLELSRSPLENGVRPAVDPLLRSLAAACGRAAVGVVLSGALRDGAAGARAVAEAGGRVLVQDPVEALVPSMPEHAIAAAGRAAEVLGAAAIGDEITRLGPPGMAARPLAGASS